MRPLIVLAHYTPLIAAIVCVGLALNAHGRGSGSESIAVMGFNALICVGVFLVFDVPRLRDARRVSRLRKIGKIANARIIKVEQTSRYLNLQPQFKVKLSYINPETEQKVVTAVKDYFAIQDVAVMRPGTVLTIRFNPDQPEEISLA